MGWLVREKGFYKSLFTIAIPIALENLITFTISMMDTVMIGALGEVQLSAVALANQVFYIFMVLTFGIGSGANVLIAQYWGKRDLVSIRKVLSLVYRVVICAAILFSLAAFFIPGQLMSIFTTDQLVIAEGIQYLKIIAFLFLAFGLATVSLLTLRGVGSVKIALLVYSVSLVVNVFFNWVFIYGNLGAPKLGVAGAAIATVMARFCELIIMICYFLFFEKKIQLKFRDLLHFPKDMLSDYLHNGVPVMFNELLWSLGASMVAVVIGRMGTSLVAANSIVTVVTQFVSVFIFGLANAGGVIVGNTVGAGQYDAAKKRAKTIMLISILVGLLASSLMLLVRPLVISFYNVPEETKRIAYELMISASIIVFFHAISAITMMGPLRGGGDARFVLINDLVFMWMVAIPLGFLTGLSLHWAAPVVYLVLKSDEILKCISAVIRLNSGRWLRDITR